MKITVSAGPWASRYMKSDPIELDLPDGSTVADALGALPVPLGEIGIVAINGKAVAREMALVCADCLKIYPVIIGG